MSRKIKNALISVSDKSGADSLARGLVELGISIISSGGTHKFLSKHDIPCKKVEDITGFPEILDGRVKTLHPVVCGGILARRRIDEHIEQMEEHSIPSIDMVVVNLYPFERTTETDDVSLDVAIENIDIGGPSLIRAAAKNHEDVVVIVDPTDYGSVLDVLRMDGDVPDGMRRDLAVKAFMLTSSYDIAIGEWLRGRFSPEEPWGPSLRFRFEKVMDARYGENPHQKGSYFREPGYRGISLANSRVIWGKELSYNNIYDIDAATDILL
ncbi:MAG: bifunctional phosphoribosylaminoimidazolecarboxamide formyltransferase/IMP cyclohydrolase, partial [Thermoplasmatota archaeon]